MPRGTRAGTRLDTILVTFCVAAALLVGVLPVAFREAFAAGLRRTVVSPLVTLQAQAERARLALITREATAVRVDSLALRAMRLAEFERENERLRAVLGLTRHLEWGFIPAEALHGRTLGEEHTLTLTAGSRAGVQPNSPVLAPEGLVGMVRTVDRDLSLAIAWTHPDFRVSAQTVDGSAFGIVNSHLSAAPDSPERYLLELRGVAIRTPIKTGTLVTSSGLGGVYPKGIPIGSVLSEIKTTEGWARTYLLRPAVRPPDIAQVFVLMPERAASEDFAEVWTSARAADSAARMMARLADSIARADSLALAARLAAARVSLPLPDSIADSARVDSTRADSVVRLDSAGRAARLARRDSLRRDSLRRAAAASARRDSVGRAVPRPDTGRRAQPPENPFTIPPAPRPAPRDTTRRTP